MGNLGANQTSIRAVNEKLILTWLRKSGTLSKSELAKRTKLTPQTLSVIMRNLEDKNYVHKKSLRRGQIGHPKCPMALNAEAAFFFGLHVGRKSLSLTMMNFVGEVVDMVHEEIEYTTIETLLRFAKRNVRAMGRKIPEECKAGIGIAMPFGIWNWAQLMGYEETRFAEWKFVDVQTALSDLLKLPTYFQNDASAACAAQLVNRTKNIPNNFLHFYVDYFIGGGVVLNDRLFTGPFGNAGALGSMMVKDRAGNEVQLLEQSSLIRLAHLLEDENLDTEFLWSREEEQWDIRPEILNQWFDLVSNGIAQAASASCCVIDFEAVVIDGHFPPHIRGKLVEYVRRAMHEKYPRGINPPQIIEGSIGKNASLIGAASLPLYDQFMIELI